MQILFNVIAFKIGWLACVLGGAHGLPLLGTAIAVAIVAAHVFNASRPSRELVLILIAGAIGAAWDSALAATGLLSYASGTLFAGTAPYWIVAMWLLFATLLNKSLRWLHGRLVFAGFVGAVCGPLAFYAGHRLGAVEFGDFGLAMIALAVGWGLIMPLLVILAQRFDGINTRVVDRAATVQI
ncbi:MAG: DUF2878 domain-containing protein [Gammaproteobacteria bacterium]